MVVLRILFKKINKLKKSNFFMVKFLKKWWFWVIVVIIVLLLIFFLPVKACHCVGANPLSNGGTNYRGLLQACLPC